MSGQAESIQQFYAHRNKLNQAYSTYKNFIKQGDRGGALRIEKQYPNLRLALVFNNFSKVLSDYSEQIDKIITSEKYTEKQKKDLINIIEKKRVEMARKANAMIKEKSKESSLVIPNLF